MNTRKLLAMLSRETSSGRFIPEIDGLRFIAIFAVVVFHLSGYLAAKSAAAYAIPVEHDWLAQIARHGKHGVELFFVISGFILGMPFAAHFLKGTRAVNLKSYFTRRVTRLEPPYILALLLLFGLLVAVKGVSATALLPHLAASMAYVHNLIYNNSSDVLVVAWSLEIEIQFYLLAPWLAKLFSLKNRWQRRAAIAGLGLSAVALQFLLVPSADHWSKLTILNYLQFFLAGFLLADIYLTEWKEAPVRHWTWDLVSLLGWPALVLLLKSEALAAVLFAPLTLLLYCAAFRGVVVNKLVTSPWVSTIGGMCYSIYLLHCEVISMVGRFARGLSVTSYFWVNLLVQLMVIGPFILVVCGAFFVLVEKPCMRKDWPAQLAARCRELMGKIRWRTHAPAAGSGLWTDGAAAATAEHWETR